MRWGFPLVSIVLNNACHGAEKPQQQRHYGGRYIGVDLVNPRFDKLAEVYGARGAYVERADQIADAVRDALAANGPSVIEIPVAEHFPGRGSPSSESLTGPLEELLLVLSRPYEDQPALAR